MDMKKIAGAALVLAAGLPLNSATAQKASAALHTRKICYVAQDSEQSICREVSLETALSMQSRPLPSAVEAAYASGYGRVWSTLATTSGKNEYSMCGGFIADETRRLVITAHHCLPPYAAMLPYGHMTFKGVPVTYIASMPEADLALFQLDAMPDEMHALHIGQAVVTEAVYGRSIQSISLADASQDQKFGISTGFEGPVSAYGTVSSKGLIQVYETASGSEHNPPSFILRTTHYEMLRLDMLIENGFSGSPLYNGQGEVLGILTDAALTGSTSYASSSKNFAELLSLYDKRKK